MTTISYPTTSAGSVVLGAIGGAFAMLVLVGAIALAALNAPAPANPITVPGQGGTQPIYNDTTPLSGHQMY